jgi:hypothetical protein
MEAALRIRTTVLPGHRIEIASPELPDGKAVDVFVVFEQHEPLLDPDDPRAVRKLPLDERRRRLREQADGMVEYYEKTAPEREEWQGGDIVEY